jgi:hypothetical protein
LFKNKFIRYSAFLLTAFLLIVAGGFLVSYPQVVRCYTIQLSGAFDAYEGNVYISKGTGAQQAGSLLLLLAQSRQRLASFWGRRQSEPTLIFCHSDELYRKYGSISGSPANYFGTPLGTFVVISPQGLNVDVLSHEMCHAELTHRVGWFTMSREVPQWFNEGIALMVDYRYPDKGVVNTYKHYQQKWQQTSMQGQIQVSLKDLETVESFYRNDNFWVNLAYLRSGLEVAKWLEGAGKQGLLDLTQNLHEGISFEEAWQKSNSD